MRLAAAAAAAAAASASAAMAAGSVTTTTEVVTLPQSDERQQPEQSRRSLQTTGAVPAQTYYIPLPERDMVQAFNGIAVEDLTGDNIFSLTSVGVAASGTWLWYDHWEDGYEPDIQNPRQSTTQIYGDGNISNGCVKTILEAMKSPPNYGYVCTSASEDEIKAGQALLFKNENPVPSTRLFDPRPTEILFDGGDLIRSSFPIALSRGGHPQMIGSLLGGAVEIVEADNYGMVFHAPVGVNTPDPNAWRHFALTEMHVMARYPNTYVYLNGAFKAVLAEGQTYVARNVNQGDVLTSSKNVQVDLLTGDPGSSYEMRWYSLVAQNLWSNDYYSPVSSDSMGFTFVYLYNPSTAENLALTVNDNVRGSASGTAAPKSVIGDTIPNASTGVRYYSPGGQKFFAITVTDYTQLYDWGHPLIPAELLTSQALVGWGYGCTDNFCGEGGGQLAGTIRSVVWLTATKAGTVYVDRDGDGQADASGGTYSITALGQLVLTDTSDGDMTGARIWAVDSSGQPSDIAVAWGQKPADSGGDDAYGLDMGTVIMPLPELAAYKSVSLYDDVDGNGYYSQNDILQYTIVVTNTGKLDLIPNSFNVVDFVDPVFDQTDYVPGSTTYKDHLGVVTPIPDSASGTAFPLDEGYNNPTTLPIDKAHFITFRVTVKDVVDGPLTETSITNIGQLLHNNGELTDEFSVTTPLYFEADIDIQTTVYPGHDGGESCTCGGDTGTELYGAPLTSAFTYCYVITNTGSTYLDEVALTDSDGRTFATGSLFLAPGECTTLYAESTIVGDSVNTATVSAEPTLQTPTASNDLNMGPVTDSDPAGVQDVPSAPPTTAPTSAPVTSPVTDAPTQPPTRSPIITTAPPTRSPVTSPVTDEPTEAPTHDPTVLRVDINITGIDQCKNFSQYFDIPTVIQHFAFLAHSGACTNAKVYYNYRPLTQEEVDSGMLDSDWTLMCDAEVQGQGSGSHTYIPPDDCVNLLVENGETIHFYVAMTYIDQGVCDGLGGSGEVVISGSLVASIWQVLHEVCPVEEVP